MMSLQSPSWVSQRLPWTHCTVTLMGWRTTRVAFLCRAWLGCAAAVAGRRAAGVQAR